MTLDEAIRRIEELREDVDDFADDSAMTKAIRCMRICRKMIEDLNTAENDRE